MATKSDKEPKEDIHPDDIGLVNGKIKKLTRKEVSKMDTREFADHAKRPFIRLLSYVRPYRSRFVAGILFGVFYGLFNAVMIFAMKFVFEMLLPSTKDVVALKIPFYGEKLIPVPELGDAEGVKMAILISLLIPLAIFIRGMLGYLNQYFMMWVGNRVLYDIRDQIFTKLLHHSLSFYSKQKTGELIQTVFNQTRMAQQAGTQLASDLVKHPISIVTMVAMLIFLDWKFAVASLVVFPLCLLPVIAVSNKVRKAGGAEEAEAGMLMVTMQESFAGIRDVKAHAREEFERTKFNRASQRMMEFIMRWRKAMEIVGPLVETVASFGIAAGLIYAKFHDMEAGEFLILYMILIGLYPHAKALSRLQIQLQKCIIATTKVFEIMDKEPEIADKPDAIVVPNPKGEIDLHDVTFSYKKGIPALQDVNLRLEPGKFYALVGPSGAGKSTLFSLLLRFYDPDQGGISLGGYDLRDLKQTSLRDNIGVVNQDTFLFHDTIEANIRYGKLDATSAEIQAAAVQAHAHDFIELQEKKYKTIVGDKGHQLSGGQRQRISIARAILRDAPILLLDEATSSLDTESEKIIQDAMRVLAEGKTVIAIAHRLSTILDADEIVVMEGGRVIDRGPHEDLLKTSPMYQRLYQLQFESHAEEE